ncbi:glutathione peroxidase [Rhodosalinus sp. K401]|uniref:glutathione peroxidase n=1 Tax=Rhodosalinus sp. K401 TaxID=3239195 RepID=UPI003525FEB3
MKQLLAIILAVFATAAAAEDFIFDSIDGGQIRLSDYAGKPVLVVNTASMCGFTPQYEGLQALYDRYRDAGLVVLAVPSNDFNQELASDDEVKEFCEITFGIDMPMTTITPVRGSGAHPFYAWLKETATFEPSWNFNKVLLDGEGRVVETFGATARPMSGRITEPVEALLAGS